MHRVSLGRCVFAAGMVVLLASVQGCGAGKLQPWHEARLSSEWTADRADEIRTFDGYLELEDALFLELEEKVYAELGTGPEYALSRYSPDSPADPRARDRNWNRSFELRAKQPIGGVLLLHGMSDSPYSLRALGESLHQRGYTVLGLRLPGHGTSPSALKTVRWEDMATAVELAARHLSASVEARPIHLIGYSTGAPLAVHYSLDALDAQDDRKAGDSRDRGEVARSSEAGSAPVPASLVLLSPAIGVHRAAALAGAKSTLGQVPGLGGLAWLQIVPEFDPYKYNSFATNAGAQVHRLTRVVGRRLAERAASTPDTILPPTLIFKSTVDATVSNEAVVERMLALLPAHRHELVLFDVNRSSVKSRLMVSDPGPFTDRLIEARDLPFSLTVVTNESPDSAAVVASYKPSLSGGSARREPIDAEWPRRVLSLSHLALPIPPHDALYGRRPPENDDALFLGEIAFRGERGLLIFPTDWLLRMRYNPFYGYLETRALDWIDRATRGEAHESR